MSVQTRSNAPDRRRGRRHVHAARGHRHRQPDQLERDRLAAHVRARDDQDAHVVVELDRLRHRALVEQRVPAFEDVDDGGVDQLGRDRLHAVRDRGARGGEVELDVDAEVGFDLRRFRLHERRQLAEDARDLDVLLHAQRAHAVVRLEAFERLDEQRLPRRARVVHDALDLAGELRLHRHDVAVVAHRDDRVLNRRGVARGAHDRRGAVARVVLRLLHAAADARERRRGAVEHVAALVDRVGDAVDDRRQRAKGRAPLAQQRHLGLRVADRAHGGVGRAERVGDRAEIPRRERYAARRRRHRLVDVVDPLHREAGILRERAHLGRLADQPPHEREVGGRLAVQRAGVRLRRMRLARIPLPDPLEVEDLEPPLVDQRAHDRHCFAFRHGGSGSDQKTRRRRFTIRRRRASVTGRA